jgi:hypothetical protein
MSLLRRVQIENIIGEISYDNSTTTPLLANAIFVGDAVEIKDFKAVGVTAIASHDSIENGLSLEFSTDGSNWDIAQKFTLTGGDYVFAQLPVQAEFFRVVFTNGPVNQTYFRMQTILHPTATIGSTLRVGDTIGSQTPAQLTRSVIAGETFTNDYKNVGVTEDNRLKVSQTEAYEGHEWTYISAASFTNGETKRFLLVPPDSTSQNHVHFTFETNAKSDYLIEYFADTTASFNGYIVADPPVINRNLNFPNNPREFRIYAFPTVEFKGTITSRYYVPGGKATSSIGNKPNEFILKNGTPYLVELTNFSGSTMYISWVADFIEHSVS